MGYAPSPFKDFESYLRNVAGFVGDQIQLILKQYIQILSPMDYVQAFTRLKIFQRLFTRWVIKKVSDNVNLII